MIYAREHSGPWPSFAIPPIVCSLSVIKTPILALVRPIPLYASVVLPPHQVSLNEIQHVQDRVRRMVGARRGTAYEDVPVMKLSDDFGLQSYSLENIC